MWFLLLLYVAHSETIQGNINRLILKSESNPCEGHVEVYNEGEWGYVGDTYWNSNIEKVVCKSTHCGIPEKSQIEHALRSSDRKVWLNEVSCSGDEDQLWNCIHPGWNISFYPKDFVKRIKCSNTISITLDGFKCAGTVRYSTDGTTPAGYFCGDNWGPNESEVLCKSLGCGEHKETIKHDWFAWREFGSSMKMTVSCLDPNNTSNLWQCALQEAQSCQKAASVICSDYQRLQLRKKSTNACSGRLEMEENGSWSTFNSTESSPDMWCKQMSCGEHSHWTQDGNGKQLTCKDKVEVVLMDKRKPSSCYGEVYIKKNNISHHVCSNNWIRKNTEVLCRELECGGVISEEKRSEDEVIMDYVKCSGKESSLWHCRAKRDDKPFKCNSIAYIVCAASVDVRLTDSPWKCAGRVEIKHAGQWKRVSHQGWTESNSHAVCRQLGCGTSLSTSPEEFSQGSGEFLPKTVECISNSSKISECISDNDSTLRKNAVGIICENRQMVFLEGNSSCSGRVGIEYGGKKHWLSASSETWNQSVANTVCQHMHCGEASSFTFTPTVGNYPVWNKSYSCSSNSRSLFQCETKTLTSNHHGTIANVKCTETGKIEVNLTNTCWGNVNICVGNKCGGVCKDTWTVKKSKMLCKNLGCGDPLLSDPMLSEKIEVIFKSLHIINNATSLNQCNLVKIDEHGTCNQKPAHVVCSGSVKTRFNASREKCSGKVEVYYGGLWLPVCDLKDKESQNIICEQQKCGQAVKIYEYFGPKAEGHVISSITSKNGMLTYNISSAQQPCTPVGLQCSSWSKMEVKLGQGACSGAVFVHSEGKMSAVSLEGWTQTEGTRLCRELECGNFMSINKRRWDESLSPFWNSSFNCKDVDDPPIWACEKPTPPSEKQLLSIDCLDEPRVTLSGNCGGDVTINEIGVCDSHWNINYSHIICQELKCSNAFNTFNNKRPETNKEYYHISCENYHYKLGQCKRFKAKCKGNLVSVYCTQNVKFTTTEKCRGQIKVNYQNRWENVHVELSSQKLKEKLCEELGCKNHNHNILIRKYKQKEKETKLYCKEDNMDIKYCMSPGTGTFKTSNISCVEENIPEPTEISVLLIILIVGIILFLVVLIIVFIRIRIVKNARNVSSKMFPREDVEFESGHYEDVTSKENEDFARGRFRSESEVIMKSDARSTSSFPYDDIDKAGETWPLAAAGTSRDNSSPEEAFNQNTDGVTYEVDDLQENYDDIEACPESHTKAEVHNSPQTPPESATEAPPGLVQDDDYLVPGLNG